MSRRYWGGVMLLSLLVTAGSGWFVWNRLVQRSGVDMPLKEVQHNEPPITMPTPAAAVQASTIPVSALPSAAVSTATVKTQVATPKAEDEAEEALAEESAGTRNISFKIRSAKAKSVAIIGDFNGWKRQALKKTRDAKKKEFWTITLALKPGTYEYQFVIDNKKVRDPNSKSVSKSGKSLLKVKAPSSH